MQQRLHFNIILIVLFCLFGNTCLAGHLAKEPAEEKAFATVTVDSQTDESCQGANDGSITYSISGINGSEITVVLGMGSSTVVETVDFTSITGGTVSGTFGNLAPASNYFIQFLSNSSETGSLSPIAVAAGDLAVQVTSTSPTCNGDVDGSISLTGSGGTAPYSYSLNGSKGQASGTYTGLEAGTYTILIEDANGCQVSQTYTLVQPDAVAAILTGTDASCSGAANGAISVQASGGDGNYQYSIDGGSTFTTNSSITGLTAGTYAVIIKDGNDCSITESITLTEPNPVVASVLSFTDVTCNAGSDGTVTFSISGGTGPYNAQAVNTTQGGSFSKSLSPGNVLTGLGPGEWDITIRDTNFCPNGVTLNVTMTDPPLFELNGILGSMEVCDGGTTSLSVSVTGGEAPYTYSNDAGTTFQSSATFDNLVAGITYHFIAKDARGCIATPYFTTTTFQLTELDPITATITQQDVSCFGVMDGSLDISATAGGVECCYEYSIDGTNFQTSGSFTGLAAGVYTVTIKDSKNCTSTSQVTISGPGEIQPAVTITDTQCSGDTGSLSVTASGGTGPYEYSLDGTTFGTGSFTGLVAGSYTITVRDASLCTTTTSATINEPAPIAATATSTDVTCNGNSDGTITITATGGLAPYTYSSDGTNFGSSATLSGLSAGNHNIIIKDANDCTETLSVNISEPAPISVTYQALPPSCIGDTDGKININLASGGTAPLKIRLQGTTALDFNIENLAPGEYDVELVDANGCTVVSSVTVPEAAPVTADVTVDAHASGCGNADGAFTMSNPIKGTGFNLSSVEYSIDGINFQSNPSFTGLTAGIYTVIIKDVSSPNNGTGNCEGTVSVTITEPSGITANVAQSNLSCNGGSDGIIGVTGATGGTAPYEYSIDGTTFGSNQNFTGLSAGSYAVTVKDASGCTISFPITLTEPDVLTATVSPTDISCNGAGDGSVSLSISGGTTPYYWLDVPTFGNNNFQTINGTTATYNAVAGSRAGNDAVIVDGNGCSIQVPFTISEPTALAASITNITDVTCNGGTDGTVTITATGGTGPYEVTADGTQYFPLASNGVVTGIGAVTIANLTVRDANGCDLTIAGFTVNEPDKIEADIVATDVSCNGNTDGSLTITATSTTNTSFEYSIDGTSFSSTNTFTQIGPGQYTLTVRETGSNCENTFSATVAEPDVLELSPTAVDVTCNGQEDGQITGSAMGGTAPYEYSIDGGTTYQTQDFTGLDIGSYTLTVRDANGCTDSKTVTIAEPTELMLSITSTTDASCNGLADGSATEAVSGGTAPYSYSLDAQNFSSTINLTALAADSYTLTVKDANDCERSATFTIAEPTAIVPTVSASTDISCNGLTDGSFTVTATGGDGTFMYSIDGTNFSATNAFTGLSADTYTVTVQDGNGCTATIRQTISEPAALSLQFEAVDITCNGAGDGQIAGIGTGGTAPYEYSLDGTNFQSTAFSGLTAGNYTLTVKDANDCKTATTVDITEPAVLTSSITSATDADCNGNSTGSAVLDVTGGSTPYSYSLDGSTFNTSIDLTSLNAGAYTVTVRDANNCQSTASFTITEPDLLGVSLSTVNDASCSGAADGSISLSAAGGTAPYQYSIDGSTFGAADAFSNLPAGNYTLTVQDANGCTASVAATVAEPAAIVLSFTTTDISCNGGTDGEITPTSTGGTAPYEYSLDGTNFQSGAFTGQGAGTYTLMVRDANGCTETAAVTLTEPAALSASATLTGIDCFGESNGSISITATGGTAPYEYSTDGSTFQSGDSFDNLAADNYTITIRDANACTTTVTATVTEPAELTVSASVINDNTISATASGGTAPYEYALDNGAFQSASTFSGLGNGDYSVTVRDANGCTVTTTGSLVVTGTDDPFTPVTISAYPNPVSDYLTFSRLAAGDQIRLVSLNGNSLDLALIMEEKEEFRMDISNIRQKIFLAIVVSKDGHVKLNKKVMKRE